MARGRATTDANRAQPAEIAGHGRLRQTKAEMNIKPRRLTALLLLTLVTLAAPGCGFAGWDAIFDLDAGAESPRAVPGLTHR